MAGGSGCRVLAGEMSGNPGAAADARPAATSPHRTLFRPKGPRDEDPIVRNKANFPRFWRGNGGRAGRNSKCREQNAKLRKSCPRCGHSAILTLDPSSLILSGAGKSEARNPRQMRNPNDPAAQKAPNKANFGVFGLTTQVARRNKANCRAVCPAVGSHRTGSGGSLPLACRGGWAYNPRLFVNSNERQAHGRTDN